MFVRQRPYKRLSPSLLFVLLWCLPGGGQLENAAPSERLYLLAATTTEHSPQSYPVRLYRVASKKLEFVREVVAQADGIRFLCAGQKTFFALHPHTGVTSVAIVHTDDPMRADDVKFSQQGVAPSPPSTAIADPPGAGDVLLAPWIINLTEPANPPKEYTVTLARVSGRVAGPGPRIQFDTWSDYEYLRYEGAPGGPNYTPGLIGSAEGENLTINFFGHSSTIDKLPSSLRGTNAKVTPFIVAADRDYLILTPQYSWEDIRSGRLGDSLKLYVKDRLKDHWSTIQSEGNFPTLRLFGQWLTTITGTWDPNHDPAPGRENERTEGEKTDRLPPVQTLYASFVGRDILRPGMLTLQNLTDGRKFRIETAQEDSEILRVDGDVVLYRVNDTIYRAKIDGTQLKDTTVVVKDEDVPEIHWVFWSK